MNFNYQYLLDFAERLDNKNLDFRILDYGCGDGKVVTAGIQRGMNIFGAEIFYGGSRIRTIVEESGLMGEIIREIDDGRIDFPNDYFDLVVSNQVIEHVEDLDKVLFEVNRVMKPGGCMVNIFPSKDIWREGHCGIPFLHWFAKSSRFRYPYALLLRRLGLGKHKDQWGPPKQCVKHKLHFIDTYCYYRDRDAILDLFTKYFKVEFIEEDYLKRRINQSRFKFLGVILKILKIPFIKPLMIEFYRKLGGLVLLARKTK